MYQLISRHGPKEREASPKAGRQSGGRRPGAGREDQGREDEGMQLIKKASKRKGVWKTDAELFLLNTDSGAEDTPTAATSVPEAIIEPVAEPESVVELASPHTSSKSRSRYKKKSGSRKKKGGIIKSIKRYLWKAFR